MNEYLFYTTEGLTQSPNGEDVENCQVLGRVKAYGLQEAKAKLLHENEWIKGLGFNIEEAVYAQILTEPQMQDISMVVDYLWEEEKRHYEETEAKGRANHIFNILKRLRSIRQ